MDEPKPMRELTRIREERGLSQQGLADASSVNKATINQIERGRRSPNLETLEKLAAALAVEIADFFPKGQASLPDFDGKQRDEEDKHIQVLDTFFVPVEEGKEQRVEFHFVRLFEEGEPILKAMRKATPDEEAAMRQELEKSGRIRE